MSGDVQPRKRKDKKKKREDDETKEQHQGVHKTKMGEDDIHLHVHSDHGTGGHWCAKIFFFALLAILIGLTGIIILENQGQDDVDTPLSESRFSNYFEGWVDEHRQDDHAHDPVIDSIEDHEDEHDDEPFEEEEDHSELEDSHVDEDEHDEEDDEHADDDDEEEDEEEATEEAATQEEDDEEDEEAATQEQSQEYEAATQEEEDEDEEGATQEDEDGDDDEEGTQENDDNDEEDDDVFDEHEPSQQTQSVESYETVESREVPLATIEIEDTSRSFEHFQYTTPGSFNDLEEEERLESKEEMEESKEESQETIEEPLSMENNESLPQESLQEEEEQVVPSSFEHIESTPTDGFTESEEDKHESQQIPSPPVTQDDEDNDDDEDDVVDESNPKVVDNDAEELALLQEKARQQAEDDGEGDDDEDEENDTTASSRSRGGPQDFDDDDDDDIFEQEFRRAEAHLHNQNFQEAFEIFDRLTTQNPDRPKAFLGKAKSLDGLAELYQSNVYLKEAIREFKRFLAFEDELKDEEFLNATQRCVERMHFLGQFLDAANIQKNLVERFPNVSDYRNQLAISYLSVNRLPEAKRVLHETLLKWRRNGVALVHYGFVCKALDNNCENAVIYLREGIETEEEGTQDARFYFNLGDCLQRLGQNKEAREVFKKGADKKMFLSEYQRSLYNVENLKAQPFWTKEQTTYSKALNELERNWEQIKEEGLKALKAKTLFQNETENLRDFGDWKQFDLFMRGIKNKENCAQTPITCGIIESFPEARTCKRGQVKFSVMHPGTHVWPHCGPTNCRLRAHLGLVVPEGTKIRVAEEERSWKEGEFLIFDDSFEHEVWHTGSSFRLVLIVDVWHPDLTKEQRLSLSPI